MGLGFLFGMMSMFWNQIVLTFAQLCDYKHHCVYFKRVNFMICKFYIDNAVIKRIKINKNGMAFAFSSPTETGI